MDKHRYFAVLHCHTITATGYDDWREEFHIILAPPLPATHAVDEARAQAAEYLNVAGQTVIIWPAEVVDVQPLLFEDGSEAVCQRPLQQS